MKTPFSQHGRGDREEGVQIETFVGSKIIKKERVRKKDWEYFKLLIIHGLKNKTQTTSQKLMFLSN